MYFYFLHPYPAFFFQIPIIYKFQSYLWHFYLEFVRPYVP